MSNVDFSKRIERIHARNTPLVVAVTGGGSGAISALLRVGGASRTVLEAGVYYAAESLTQWLGSRPEHFCSARTARAMAMVAFERARQLTVERVPCPAVGGVACTASLASDRPKRGEHRAYVAWQTRATTWVAAIVLRKGHRSRGEEEDLVAGLNLAAVEEATKQMVASTRGTLLLNDGQDEREASIRQDLGLLDDESLTMVRQDAPPGWQELVVGERQVVGARGETPDLSRPRAIFPGAFNPRHQGHQQMAEIAERRLGRTVEYELSIANVDKPPLDYIEMATRAEQFVDGETAWFTRAPTFVEKGAIFPGCVFVVGADTIIRIAEPRYYEGNSPTEQLASRDQAIAAIAAHGSRFLVFGRRHGSGFQSLDSIDIPDPLRALCDSVPECEFRADISSTELRRAADTDSVD